MGRIEFTDNYREHSNRSGFQFEFFCECCGNGYMSSWAANASGIAGSVLQGAGDLLGGIFGRAAAGASGYMGGKAKDSALAEAVAEIKPLFVQCKRCGQWVCREICWNAERSLCKKCAPILQREMAAAQAEIAVEQATEKLRQRDQTEGVNFEATAVVHCPKCGAEAAGGKFCPECGASLAPKTECPKCGAKVGVGTKFCQECGQKLA